MALEVEFVPEVPLLPGVTFPEVFLQPGKILPQCFMTFRQPVQVFLQGAEQGIDVFLECQPVSVFSKSLINPATNSVTICSQSSGSAG